MTDLHARLRAGLTEALRQRDRDTARVLRTVLSAIANAEAQPADPASTSLPSAGPIAGASTGVGTTEVARRELAGDGVRAIVRAERDERLAAADGLAERGATGAAATLVTEAALLERYLADD